MSAGAHYDDCLGFRRGRWAKPHDNSNVDIIASKSFERLLVPQQVFMLASYCQFRDHMVPVWPSVQYRIKGR